MAAIKGLEELDTLLKKYSGQLPDEVDAELSAGAEDIAATARTLAPVGVSGDLRRRIIVNHAPFIHEVVANVYYAPFVEFGTGKKVKVSAGLEQYAAQFKGPTNRGNINDFRKSLAEWVRRKGITGNARGKQSDDDRYIAYWMSIRILQNGIKPQPFFFRSADAQYPKIIKRIEEILKIK